MNFFFDNTHLPYCSVCKLAAVWLSVQQFEVNKNKTNATTILLFSFTIQYKYKKQGMLGNVFFRWDGRLSGDSNKAK